MHLALANFRGQKWSEGLIDKIHELTGSRKFTHVTAVTKLNGDASDWETYEPFSRTIYDNPIKLLTLKTMLDGIHDTLSTKLEPSEVGRLLQVIKASGWRA